MLVVGGGGRGLLFVVAVVVVVLVLVLGGGGRGLLFGFVFGGGLLFVGGGLMGTLVATPLYGEPADNTFKTLPIF